MTAAPRLAALVAHVRHVPVTEREDFSARIADAAVNGLLLKTCHRVEYYTIRAEELRRLEAVLPPGGELLTGEAACRHAIAVAVGLDSVVVGEDQVLHQLRTSVAEARRAARLDPVLERLFTLALRAGRQARSWRQGPPHSLATAALAVLQTRAGPLRGRGVLIVGAGEMAHLAATAATAAGATVTIASRTPAHAASLARRLDATSAPFDPGPGSLGELAGAIVALRGPWAIGPSTAELLASGSGVVVDLSVPPAVPAGVVARLDSRFVSVDELGAEDVVAPGWPASRLAGLVEATAAEFMTWLAGGSNRAAAAALAERAEQERRDELEELWRRMPDLEPEARGAIEAMSHHLAGRLLREPLERLGRDTDGRAERAARELFAL